MQTLLAIQDKGPPWLPLLYLGWVALVLWLIGVAIPRYLLPPQRHRAVPWSGYEVVLALLGGLLFWPVVVRLLLDETSFLTHLYGPGFIQDLKAEPADSDRHVASEARIGIWSTALALPLQVLYILIIFFRESGTRPYHLGLTRHRLGRNVLLGGAFWVVFTPLILGLYAAVQFAYERLTDLPPEKHPLEGLVRGKPLLIDWIMLVFTATVAAPVLEELLFRGVLQPWLARRSWGCRLFLGMTLVAAILFRGGKLGLALKQGDMTTLGFELAPSAFVLLMLPGYFAAPVLLRRSLPRAGDVRALYTTALVFAMSHTFAWPSPIPLFFLGLVLGWLAYRTQSLVPSMVLHGLFNAVSCVELFSRSR